MILQNCRKYLCYLYDTDPHQWFQFRNMIIFITRKIWLLWKWFLVPEKDYCLNFRNHPSKSSWNLPGSFRRRRKSRKYLERAVFEYCGFEYCGFWVKPLRLGFIGLAWSKCRPLFSMVLDLIGLVQNLVVFILFGTMCNWLGLVCIGSKFD